MSETTNSTPSTTKTTTTTAAATTTTNKTTLGFIGLGKIGYALARNIITKFYNDDDDNNATTKALHYDINQEISNQFAQEVPQSKAASSAEEVASNCDIVFTALPNDDILLKVVFGHSTNHNNHDDDGRSGGINARLTPSSSIHVSCSTVSPTTSRTISSAHAKRNVGFVAAPIFARPDGLALGHATIPISSSKKSYLQIVKPLLELSATTVQDHFGTKEDGGDDEEDDPGAANVVKLAGNFLIASAIESMSEAYAFVEQQGLNRTSVHSLLSTTIFDCLIYKGYGQRIASRDHTPYPHAHFALDLGKKDVNLVQKTAEENGVVMPTVDLLAQRFEEAVVEKKRGDLDWSAIGLSVSEEAGVNVEEYERYCRREDPKIDWKPPT